MNAAMWLAALNQPPADPAAWPSWLSELRAQWRQLALSAADVADDLAATAWRRASPEQRRQVVAAVLADHLVGPHLAAELIQAVAGRDLVTAQTALTLLAGATLDAAQWRQIGRVAAAERAKKVPDVDAAALLARQGPPEALPTVVLTAFRPGPEDADDRLVAISHLGRWRDDAIPALLARLASTGSCHLEIIQSVAHAMSVGHARAFPDDGHWAGVLVASLCCDQGHDAISRWSALDGLCHLEPATAARYLAAAQWPLTADDPSWFRAAVTARGHALQPAPGQPVLAEAPLPARTHADGLKPLPGLALRVQSRDARVARQAAVQSGVDAADLAMRAAWEASMVARGQLLGSLLPPAAPAPLPSTFSPNWLVLDDAERRDWLAREATWLQPSPSHS